MTTVIGFDPGLTGAFAVLGQGRALAVDLPVLTSRRAIDAWRLAFMLRAVMDPASFAGPDERYAFVVEDVRHIPGTPAGPAAMASLLHSKGVIEGVVGALGHGVTLVDAQKWQKLYGLKSMKTKDGRQSALDRAVTLYPTLQATLGRVRDQNRVAAVLIAHWGLRA